MSTFLSETFLFLCHHEDLIVFDGVANNSIILPTKVKEKNPLRGKDKKKEKSYENRDNGICKRCHQSPWLNSLVSHLILDTQWTTGLNPPDLSLVSQALTQYWICCVILSMLLNCLRILFDDLRRYTLDQFKRNEEKEKI